MSEVNFIVVIQDSRGRTEEKCQTEQEVWDAIGRSLVGSLYTVYSPTNKDCSDFIPY